MEPLVDELPHDAEQQGDDEDREGDLVGVAEVEAAVLGRVDVELDERRDDDRPDAADDEDERRCGSGCRPLRVGSTSVSSGGGLLGPAAPLADRPPDADAGDEALVGEVVGDAQGGVLQAEERVDDGEVGAEGGRARWRTSCRGRCAAPRISKWRSTSSLPLTLRPAPLCSSRSARTRCSVMSASRPGAVDDVVGGHVVDALVGLDPADHGAVARGHRLHRADHLLVPALGPALLQLVLPELAVRGRGAADDRPTACLRLSSGQRSRLCLYCPPQHDFG